MFGSFSGVLVSQQLTRFTQVEGADAFMESIFPVLVLKIVFEMSYRVRSCILFQVISFSGDAPGFGLRS